MIKLRIANNLELREADQELKDYLKDLLTMLNPEWEDAQTFNRWVGNIPRFISQYSEEDNVVKIPRGLLVHLTEDLGREFEISDLRVTPQAEKRWPEGIVTLRESDQEPAVQKLLNSDNGFLAASAGAGKTIMALEATRRTGLKALWLTHRKELKDQVIERAEELFGFRPNSVGILHGKQWDIGEQLTVGMIPTLRRRDLSDIEDEFGIVVVDEAHHVPSTTFLQVINKFNAKYLYGLTATAYRRDKLDAIMFNAIGPVISKIEHVELFEDKHLIKPLIRRRMTGWVPIESNKMEYHDFMDSMVHSEQRNSLIVEDIVRECRPGNTCVVLVERTKHAEILTSMIKKQGLSCEFVVGSVDVDTPENSKDKKKKKAIPKEVRDKIVNDFKNGKTKVLVATYDLLAEGFDHKPLNRLFMATPIKWKGTVVQAIGRVQRPHPNKKEAIVYDYVDDGIAMFWRQSEARYYGVYEKMGMPVE